MRDRVSQVHPESSRRIAHFQTNYSHWRTATEIYDVDYEWRYEPYFVANKRVPRYDASFVGYGDDKVQHCGEIHVSNMTYKVLPEAFYFI